MFNGFSGEEYKNLRSCLNSKQHCLAKVSGVKIRGTDCTKYNLILTDVTFKKFTISELWIAYSEAFEDVLLTSGCVIEFDAEIPGHCDKNDKYILKNIKSVRVVFDGDNEPLYSMPVNLSGYVTYSYNYLASHEGQEMEAPKELIEEMYDFYTPSSIVLELDLYGTKKAVDRGKYILVFNSMTTSNGKKVGITYNVRSERFIAVSTEFLAAISGADAQKLIDLSFFECYQRRFLKYRKSIKK